MLVLNRQKEETVFIGENINVKVVSIHGDTVKLGISAPVGEIIFRCDNSHLCMCGKRVFNTTEALCPQCGNNILTEQNLCPDCYSGDWVCEECYE